MSSSVLNTSTSQSAVTESATVRLRGGQYSLCVSAFLTAGDAATTPVLAGVVGASSSASAATPALVDPILSGCGGDRGIVQLQLQSLGTGNVWAAELDSEYVELITKKTGNYKRFPVLVEMLISALKQDSLSLSIDLLTQEDLAALRSANGHASRRSMTSEDDGVPVSISPQNHRRCRAAICLHAAPRRHLGFHLGLCRVHYPLPLTYQPPSLAVRPAIAPPSASSEKNGPGMMVVGGARPVARELRNLVDNLQAERSKHLEDIETLRRLNNRLSRQLQESTAAQVATAESLNATIESLQEENIKLVSERDASEAAFSRLHAEAEREVRCIQQEFDDLCAEIEEWKEYNQDAKGGFPSALHRNSSGSEHDAHVEKLHKLVQGLIKELHRTKAQTEKDLLQKVRDIEDLSAKLDVSRMTEKSLRARCKDLTEKNQKLRAKKMVAEFNPVVKSRPIRAAIHGRDGFQKPRAPAQRASSSRATMVVNPREKTDQYWSSNGRTPYTSPYAQSSISPSRPRGSPAKFNPTEYVRQRQRIMAERRARSLSAGRVFRTGILADTFRDINYDRIVPVESVRQPAGRSRSAGSSKQSGESLSSRYRPPFISAYPTQSPRSHNWAAAQVRDISPELRPVRPPSKNSQCSSLRNAARGTSRGAEASQMLSTRVRPGRRLSANKSPAQGWAVRRRANEKLGSSSRHIPSNATAPRQRLSSIAGDVDSTDDEVAMRQRRYRPRAKRTETPDSLATSSERDRDRSRPLPNAREKVPRRYQQEKGVMPPVGGTGADDSEDDVEARLKALQAYLLSQRGPDA